MTRAADSGARRHAVVIAAAIGLVFTLVCFWPGYMSEDSISQLAQARSGDYDPWHPPVMSWTWRMTDRVLPGPAGMLVLHAVLLWSGLALVVAGTIVRPARAAAALIALGFFPPVLALVGTVWKDVALGVALVLAFGLLLAAEEPRSRVAVVASLPLLFYAAAVRYNGAAAMLPLSLWAGTIVVPRRAGLAVGAGLFAALLALAVVTNAWLSGGRTPRSFRVLFVGDIVATALDSGEKIPPPAPPDEPMSAIVARWRRAILTHPAAYLWHRMLETKRLLGIGTSAVCYPFQERSVQPNPFVADAPPGALNRTVMAALEAVKNGPLFRVWVYLALCAVWAVVGRRRVAALALAASGMLYLVPYYVIAPDCDFRYAWWTVLAALLLPLVVLGGGQAEPA